MKCRPYCGTVFMWLWTWDTQCSSVWWHIVETDIICVNIANVAWQWHWPLSPPDLLHSPEWWWPMMLECFTTLVLVQADNHWLHTPTSHHTNCLHVLILNVLKGFLTIFWHISTLQPDHIILYSVHGSTMKGMIFGKVRIKFHWRNENDLFNHKTIKMFLNLYCYSP